MVFKLTIGIVALALLVPFLYERGQVLSTLFWQNAPARLVRINTFASHEVKFADRIRSCEDALLVESEGLAILACDPGRERWNTVMGIFHPGPVESGKLYVFDYADTSASEDQALKQLEFVDFEFHHDFHTLGMAFNESTSTLFVASHRHDQPAVEVFKLDLEAYTATHLRSIQHPLIKGPNAIALINDHEFYVTNSNYFLIRDHPALNKLELHLGLPGGTVVHVDFSPMLAGPQKASVQAHVVQRLAFANGIELLNDTTAAVSSTGKAKVNFYSISRSQNGTGVPNFTYLSEVKVPFSPDNLSISKDGALIIAGHPHVPSLGKFTETRHICNSAVELAKADASMQETCKTLAAPSWAARWTEEGGLQNLYVDTEYPSSATAARDSERKIGIISGLYAKGVLVWRE
ncbi:putative paraoxonase [Astrocystis sublimbata]|nr:putative paraoxonase [Astrocystis sublimbata]